MKTGEFQNQTSQFILSPCQFEQYSNNSQNQLFEKLEHSQTSVGLGQTASDIFCALKIKCPCNNDGALYCATQSCKSNPIICQIPNSLCFQQNHKKCTQTFVIANLHTKLIQKIKSGTSFVKKTIQLLRKTVDEITNRVSQMQEQIERQINFFGLNSSDYQLTEKILCNFKENHEFCHFQPPLTEQNYSFLNGKIFSDYAKQTNESERCWFKYSIQKFESIISKTQKQVTQSFLEIQNLIVSLHAKYDSSNSFANNFVKSSIFSQKSNKSHLNKFASLKNILNQNIQIDSIKKLFTYEKSHPNNLHHQQIFSAIQSKSNLLFLAKNDKNQTFGFFTSQKFCSINMLNQNPCKNTFVFSLDSGIYEKCIEHNFSLKYHRQKGKISIGNHDKYVFGLSFDRKVLRGLINLGSMQSKMNENSQAKGQRQVSVVEVYEVQVLRHEKSRKIQNKSKSQEVLHRYEPQKQGKPLSITQTLPQTRTQAPMVQTKSQSPYKRGSLTVTGTVFNSVLDVKRKFFS